MKIPASVLSLALFSALFVSCGQAPEPETPESPGKLPPPESTDHPDPQAGTGTGKSSAPVPLPPGESRYKPRGLTGPQAGKSQRDISGETEGTGESSKEFHTVEVFYGTNRKPTGFREPNEFYGRERNREGPVTYGKIDVSIPLHHTVGVVERPKWYKLEFSEDPKKHVVMVKLETLEKDDFFTKVDDKAKTYPKRQALLFIHGFNVSFPDAIRRTAQIAYDLDFEGTALAFSWPSQAALEAYTVDQDNAVWSAPHLSRFLLDLQEKSDLEEIHIIAHSMGTRVLTQALALAHDEGFSLKFNNVILAAPDIDADVFKDQILPKIKGSADRLTMYSSSGDTALKVSQKIHGNDRLGLGGEFLKRLEGMDTINATDIDTSLIGHAYYGSHRVVVKDLLDLVVHHLDPPHRDLVRGTLGEWDFKLLKEDTETDGNPDKKADENSSESSKAKVSEEKKP
ncbi:MAG: alpha/beta hydrolase [Verrucomicrobiae bacterium]|nr:alpha/beta hydrolase [Verrucomicrobiae bacterium]